MYDPTIPTKTRTQRKPTQSTKEHPPPSPPGNHPGCTALMYPSRPQHLNATRRPASIKTSAQETAKTVLTRASIHPPAQPTLSEEGRRKVAANSIATRVSFGTSIQDSYRSTPGRDWQQCCRELPSIGFAQSEGNECPPPSLRRYSGPHQDFCSGLISKYSQRRLATVLTTASIRQHRLVSRDNRPYPTSPQ